MPDRFTYFRRDGTREVREGEAARPQPGEVWVRGEYEGNVVPSALEVRVGEAVKVWLLVLWMRIVPNDPKRVREQFAPWLSDEDIEAALWFYEQNRDEIDARIKQESEAA